MRPIISSPTRGVPPTESFQPKGQPSASPVGKQLVTVTSTAYAPVNGSTPHVMPLGHDDEPSASAAAVTSEGPTPPSAGSRAIIGHALKLLYTATAHPVGRKELLPLAVANSAWRALQQLGTLSASKGRAQWLSELSFMINQLSSRDRNVLAKGFLFDQDRSAAAYLAASLQQNPALKKPASDAFKPDGQARRMIADLQTALTSVLSARQHEAALCKASKGLTTSVAKLNAAVKHAGRAVAFSALSDLGRQLDGVKSVDASRLPLPQARAAISDFIDTLLDNQGGFSRLAQGELGVLNAVHRWVSSELLPSNFPHAALKAELQLRQTAPMEELQQRYAHVYAQILHGAPAIDIITSLQRASEAMEKVLLVMNGLNMDVGPEDKIRVMERVEKVLARQFAVAESDKRAPNQRIGILLNLFNDLIDQGASSEQAVEVTSLLNLPTLAVQLLTSMRSALGVEQLAPPLLPDARERKDWANAIEREFGLGFDWTEHGLKALHAWLDATQWQALRKSYTDGGDTRPARPWTTLDAAGQQITLSLNPVFMADAIERPSVAISVEGVADDGTWIHHTARALSERGLDEQVHESCSRADVLALHALAGNDVTLLSRIMNQQIMAPLVNMIAERGLIHDQWDQPLSVGGPAKLNFTVRRVQGPGSDYVIGLVVRMEHRQSATRFIDGMAEGVNLHPTTSYLRATMELRVTPKTGKVMMDAPPRFQYNADVIPSSP